MVQEITSGAELRQVVGSGKLAVIDFTASWCGPCRMAAPQFEAMAQRYPDVIFAKVVEDHSRELIMSEGIRAFPTFRLYHNSQVLDEIQGANIPAVEAAVQRHRASLPAAAFSGSGTSLGGGGSAAAAAEDARAARLRRLGIDPNAPPPTKAPAPAPAPTPAVAAPAPTPASASAAPMEVDGGDAKEAEAATTADGRTAADLDAEDAEDEALLAEAIKKAQLGGGAGGEGTGGAVQMVEPPVDEEMLKQLLEFEFPEVRAKKALLAVGANLEAAINWITDHQDDADIDAPIPLVPMLDMASLPGAGPPKKKLTVEELKARIAARRAERAELEKADEVNREKARREAGKNIGKTNEELQRLQRKREAELRKKEKEDFARERERLRAEIAKDKAERAARKGRLPGVLDAEGYNPTGLQGSYGAPGDEASEEGVGGSGSGHARKASAASAADEGTPLEQADKAISLMKRQRVGDNGGIALKTLIAYVKNIAENPAEPKYRAIKTDNNAYKTRVGPVLGGVALLRAVGFVKNEAEGKWELAEGKVDVALLGEVKHRLETALHEYAQAI